MGELAEEMISGVSCECCGEYLQCDECADNGIPAYCSVSCAHDRGASKRQVCRHELSGWN